MVTPESGKRKRSEEDGQHQWYSSHILVHNQALETSRQNALNQRLAVNIHPNNILEYMDNGLQSIEPNVFYVSEVTNQNALDVFTSLDDLLYIFQFTVASKHDVNHGLIDVAD
jgi:hypothetical protein